MFHASFRRNKIGMKMLITFELPTLIFMCIKIFLQTRTIYAYKCVYAVTMVTEKINFTFVLHMDLFF